MSPRTFAEDLKRPDGKTIILCPWCEDLIRAPRREGRPTGLVSCAECGRRYHEICRQESSSCTYCGTRSVEVVPPPRPKREPISTASSTRAASPRSSTLIALAVVVLAGAILFGVVWANRNPTERRGGVEPVFPVSNGTAQPHPPVVLVNNGTAEPVVPVNNGSAKQRPHIERDPPILDNWAQFLRQLDLVDTALNALMALNRAVVACQNSSKNLQDWAGSEELAKDPDFVNVKNDDEEDLKARTAQREVYEEAIQKLAELGTIQWLAVKTEFLASRTRRMDAGPMKFLKSVVFPHVDRRLAKVSHEDFDVLDKLETATAELKKEAAAARQPNVNPKGTPK